MQKSKKLISVLLSLLMVMSVSPVVFAAETVAYGTCGEDIEWVVTDDGVLTIKGNGAMADYSDGDSVPWCDYREDIIDIVVLQGVTAIGERAFYYFENLKHVSIPDSVLSVGPYAFYNCGNVEEITLPYGVSSIGKYAFYGCKKLTEMKIPTNVTEISASAFRNCEALSDVQLSANTASIADSAFYGCAALEDIYIPGSVITIGDSAFTGCTALESVDIGAGLNTIEDNAFKNCSSLVEFSVSEDNSAFSSKDGVLFDKEKTVLVQYPANKAAAEYVVPEGVVEIREYAFSGSNNLQKLTLSDSLTTIGRYAFYNCEALGSVVISVGVTEIPFYAFSGCSSLTDVTVASSVVTVVNSAFNGCSALAVIHYCGTEAQWNQISVGATNNSYFENATRHYCVQKSSVPATCIAPEITAGWYCEECDVIVAGGKETGSVNPDAHQGGTATCTSGAICELCFTEYGSTDADNHSGHEYYYVYADALSHGQYYSCCGAFDKTRDHVESKPATCALGAYCELCDNYFGAPDKNNHTIDYSLENADIIRPYQNSDNTWSAGICTYYCTGCDVAEAKEVSRADYTGYDANLQALENVCQNELLSSAAKQEITDFINLYKASPRYDLIVGEEELLNRYSKEILVYTTKIKAGISGCENDSHSYENWVVSEENDSFHFGTCEFCGDVTMETHSGGTPDCMHGAFCRYCNYEWTNTDVNNHVNLVSVEAQAPTCTQAGWEKYEYCECGYTTYDEIPAGHKIVVDAAVAPSCTETGLTEGSHCSECGDILVPQETVKATDHDYTAVVTAPTCTEDGYTTYTCADCYDSYVADETPATGHADEDNDYICDNGCGYEFEKPADPEEPDAPEEPETPDDDSQTSVCDRCGKTHANGFDSFICLIKYIINYIVEFFTGLFE